MTKTTAPRVRAENLYTVEQDGQPVAQAMAISQAEAVRLYVESVQQPTMTARLSSPLEARTLAWLPLLSRDAPASPAVSTAACASVLDLQPERDPRVPDLFEDAPAAAGPAPAADHVVDAAEMAQEVAAAPKGAPAELVLLDASAPAVCDPVQIGETSSPSGLPAEFLDYLEGEEVAAAPQGEPMPSAPSTAAPTVSPAPAAVELPDADEPTLSERMAGAYAAGVEVARQGHTRWSTEFLDADAAALSGLRDAAADAAHAEMLRGFDDGKAQAEPVGTQERRRPPDEAPKGAGKVPVKYRSPATGESWSGRGLRPRWVLLAMDEGKALEDFAV